MQVREKKEKLLNSQNFKQARCTSFHLIFFSLSVLCPSQVTMIGPLPYIHFLKKIRKHQCIHEDPLLEQTSFQRKMYLLHFKKTRVSGKIKIYKYIKYIPSKFLIILLYLISKQERVLLCLMSYFSCLKNLIFSLPSILAGLTSASATDTSTSVKYNSFCLSRWPDIHLDFLALTINGSTPS